MSQTSISLQNAILGEIFNGTDLSGGTAPGLSLPGTLYASLHTNDPGDGPQSSNEFTQLADATGYVQYARAQLVRSPLFSSRFTVSLVDSYGTPTDNITFNQRLSGGADAIATHIGIGTAASASGTLLYRSPLILSSAAWLYAICTASSNEVQVVSQHAGGVTFAEGDSYEVLPLYNDVLPSPLLTTTRYYIKVGSLPGGVVSYVSGGLNTILKLATSGDTLVDFTVNGAFQLIRSAPLTVAVTNIPVIPALTFKYFLT